MELPIIVTTFKFSSTGFFHRSKQVIPHPASIFYFKTNPTTIRSTHMLMSILIFLLYVIIAVIIAEVIFWILTLIFGAIITPRIRGLLYALLLVIILIYALEHFGVIH